MADPLNPETIGRDVTVYTLQGAGLQTFTYAGKWESVEIKLKFNYATATPADGTTVYKRFTTYEFSGTLSNFMDTLGSGLLTMAIGSTNVSAQAFPPQGSFIMYFTEANSGKQMFCFAGIDDAGFTANQEAWKDTLSFSSIGLYNGAVPLTYM